jgi:hypothetical protein
MAAPSEPSNLKSRVADRARAGDEDALRIHAAVLERDGAEAEAAAAEKAAKPVDGKRAQVEDKMAGAGL